MTGYDEGGGTRKNRNERTLFFSLSGKKVMLAKAALGDGMTQRKRGFPCHSFEWEEVFLKPKNDPFRNGHPRFMKF